jgi:hypothetical protein
LVENFEDAFRVLELALLVVFTSLFAVIEEDLVSDKLPEDLLIESVLLELKVKVLDAGVARLVLFLVQFLKERVLKSLLCAQSLSRVIA